MTLTVTPSNGNLDVNFNYLAPIDKATQVLTDAGEELYARGFYNYIVDDVVTPWETLTNPQKLAVLDLYVRKVVLDLAKSWHISQSISDARVTATAEIDTIHGL